VNGRRSSVYLVVFSGHCEGFFGIPRRDLSEIQHDVVSGRAKVQARVFGHYLALFKFAVTRGSRVFF
jgi:hypothetical protein